MDSAIRVIVLWLFCVTAVSGARVLAKFRPLTIPTDTYPYVPPSVYYGCAAACIKQATCRSFGVNATSCELRDANSQNLSTSGFVYFENQQVEQKDCRSTQLPDPTSDVFEAYPIFRTVELFSSVDALKANARCAESGAKLCNLGDLLRAYEVGYRHDQWGLFEHYGGLFEHDGGSGAKLIACNPSEREDCLGMPGETNYIHHQNPATGDLQGFCCPHCYQFQGYPILRRRKPVYFHERDRVGDFCRECSLFPCSLDQMKAAYEAGFRDEHWGHIDLRGTEIRPSACTSEEIAAGGCSFPDEGLIPNRTAPADVDSISYPYCCPK
ncbi:uncharacterized protein LOC119733930 [Patiria miniata]|uniref:Apple domain-containing protein n=1 Tax=Patiria miniata TaxID=46514 RepID=A0A914AIJ1_PATMI|nr:uncharacterized protein LOC119733930 [Patiria miniata]